MTDPLLYTPSFLCDHHPSGRDYPNLGSPWRGLERLLPALIRDFALDPSVGAVEFGVEGGYSTAALADHFSSVTAIDHFLGDEHSGVKPDAGKLERETRANLAAWPNVTVVTADCFEWMRGEVSGAAAPAARYALAHIDIIHTYQPTLHAALWGCAHADLVILHDTVSFPDVARACAEAALLTGREFWNWPENFGLGILARRKATTR